MPIRDILKALIVVAIWGFNFVVIKLSVDALPPILAAALRFTFAAVPAVFFLRPPKTKWYFVVGFGVAFGFALYVLLNLAIFIGMPAGLASVVLQVQAFFTILIALFVFKDVPRHTQILGGVIAFVGIGVIGYQHLGEGAGIWPFALTVAGALAWGTANVIAKAAGKVNAVAFTAWGALSAVVPLYLVSFLTEGFQPFVDAVTQPSVSNIVIIAFLAYPASLFGVAVWNSLLAKHPASVVAPFTLLVPITGLLSGWLVLGETVSVMEIAGGLLVVVGLGVTVIRPRGKGIPVSSAPPESGA